MKMLLQVSIVLTYSVCLSLGSTCPTWFYHPHQGDSECECGTDFNGVIMCDNGTQEVSILNTFCMTRFSDKDEALVVGRCFISQRNAFLTKIRDYFKLPSNASEVEYSTCGHLNRKGRLCGELLRHSTHLYIHTMTSNACIASRARMCRY